MLAKLLKKIVLLQSMKYDIDLSRYNTFGLHCVAKKFLIVANNEDLQELAKLYQNNEVFILGTGANTVFAEEKCDKIVAKVENLGKKIVEENEEYILLEVASGENWDDFVSWATMKNYSGLENLAGIPSSIGATPIQNIGAYGMEVKNIIDYVICFDLKQNQWVNLTKQECKFGYRDSVFKHTEKNLVIWKVGFRLNKKFTPNIDYKDIKNKIETEKVEHLTPQIIAQTIRQIRNNKLPDYKILGNVGSFFKNPIISLEQYLDLKKSFPNIVAFDERKNKKISAAWLIEQCGYKGKRIGNVGMHSTQALVMVNYGSAKGKEVIGLANEIKESIKQRFNINLEIEANII